MGCGSSKSKAFEVVNLKKAALEGEKEEERKKGRRRKPWLVFYRN